MVLFTTNGTTTESVASDQTCLILKSTVPVITHVTIDKTSKTDGQITVKWTRPIGLTEAYPKKEEAKIPTGLTGAHLSEEE